MSWIITFHIIGDLFDHRKVNLEFNNANLSTEIAVIGKNKGKQYGCGSASYIIPNHISRLKKFSHLADLFEPKLEELKLAGADDWWIEIGRLYEHQCNEELGSEELIQIARLKCSLSYSAYQVSEKELKNGWSQS